jgi:hypothetical protein
MATKSKSARKTTAKIKTAREQIREHVKEVRENNAAAHEARLANCTAAVETTPLSESDCAKAADAWIDAKEGRRDRYGVAEATSGVIDGKCTVTTTNFAMVEVHALTGKAKFIGWSPLKPQVLKLTSSAKMGAARPTAQPKSKAARLAATKRAKAVAEGKGRDWSALRSVTPEQAEQYAELLLAGTTARRAEQDTGPTARQRVAVEKVLSRAGYKFHRELNTGYDKSDAMQRFLYRMDAPAAS